MKLLRRIRSWYRARNRNYDRTLLWPSLCRIAASREHAIEGFMVHASLDPAWCEELTPEQARAVVSAWPWEGSAEP